MYDKGFSSKARPNHFFFTVTYPAATSPAKLCIKPTNPVAVIADLDDGLVLPQVPHHCFPAGVGRGQDVLHLPVPGHHADVFSRLRKEAKLVINR